MDESEFEAALLRLEKAQKVVSKFTEESLQLAALELLGPYIVGEADVDREVPDLEEGRTSGTNGATGGRKSSTARRPAGSGSKRKNAEELGFDESAVRGFLGKQDGTRPSDNVYSIIAWFYSEYGVATFSTAEIEAIAHGAGVTVPSRVDKTMAGMAKDGKPLVNKSGRQWRVTVHGELYFQEKYGVSKGTKTRTV